MIVRLITMDLICVNVIILGPFALESSTVFRFGTFISEMMERKDDNDNHDIFFNSVA